MGADTDQIHWIRGTRDSKGKLKQFNIATDMPLLKAAAEEFGAPSLLIIDPIYEAVEGDPNKMNEVLDGLAPLVDFASEMNCAVQGLIHLNKNQNARNFLERIIHSRAFTTKPRIILGAAKERDSDRRILFRAKSNIGPSGNGFAYTIEQINIAPDIDPIKIIFGEQVKGSPEEILANCESGNGEKETTQISQARAFLLQKIINRQLPAWQKDLQQEAEQLGISEKTLERAADKVGGITKHKDGLNGGWYWCWSLPINLNNVSNAVH
jgi:hypothetical protein